MAVVDPFVSLRDWRSSLYRGDPAVDDQIASALLQQGGRLLAEIIRRGRGRWCWRAR